MTKVVASALSAAHTHLKESEEIEVGYWFSWHSLFLLNPSQQLTVPSQPPVAKVPEAAYNGTSSIISSKLA